MNLYKKISLVYTLQVSAVVIIFAYPRLSSTIVQKENKPAAESPAKKIYTGTGINRLNTGQFVTSPAEVIETQIAPAFFSFKPGK